MWHELRTRIAHRTFKGTDGLTRAQRDALARRYLTDHGGAPLLNPEQLELLHRIAHHDRRQHRH